MLVVWNTQTQLINDSRTQFFLKGIGHLQSHHGITGAHNTQTSRRTLVNVISHKLWNKCFSQGEIYPRKYDFSSKGLKLGREFRDWCEIGAKETDSGKAFKEADMDVAVTKVSVSSLPAARG